MKKLINLCIVVAAIVACAWATPAPVQQSQNITGNTSSLTGIAAGDMLAAWDAYHGSYVSGDTCTDGVNTWAAAGHISQGGSQPVTLTLFYALNVASGSATVTCTAHSGSQAVSLDEYSGIATSGALDGSTVGTATIGSSGSTTITWGSISFGAGDIVIAAAAAATTNTTGVTAWSSPFSNLYSSPSFTGNEMLAYGYAVTTSPAAASGTIGSSSQGIYITGLEAAFLPASGSGAVVARHRASECCENEK